MNKLTALIAAASLGIALGAGNAFAGVEGVVIVKCQEKLQLSREGAGGGGKTIPLVFQFQASAGIAQPDSCLALPIPQGDPLPPEDSRPCAQCLSDLTFDNDCRVQDSAVVVKPAGPGRNKRARSVEMYTLACGVRTAGGPTDHFRCYAVDDKSKLAKSPVSLADQFGSDPAVEATKAATICVPVDKAGEGISNPDTHLVCYNIVPRKSLNVNVAVDNQFGEQTLRVLGQRTLCVPSTKQVIE